MKISCNCPVRDTIINGINLLLPYLSRQCPSLLQDVGDEIRKELQVEGFLGETLDANLPGAFFRYELTVPGA